MLFRTSLLAAAAILAVAGFGAAPAQAGAIMSLNNRVTDDLPHKECMTRARAAIREAGFRYHDTTSEAVWGTAHDRRDMVAIYCLTTRDIAVFAAASPTGDGKVTAPLVDRLTDAWETVK